ncbi:hypothetical protein BDR04DRAFT_1149255 [Suillus decipiens]|nr:hypothetical protein BDR04DRAFT_1149255 [Suillus decipiens]
MPFSRVKDFIKNSDVGKVFVVRLRRGRTSTQRGSTTTHHHGHYSIPADIPSELPVPSSTLHLNSSLLVRPGCPARDPSLPVSNISSTASSDGDSSARKASDMAQAILPFVQDVAGAIPFAGPPMQAAISGLLSILQAIDRRSQNKADLDCLASRLHRLSSHLCNAPTAQDPLEHHRRDFIIRYTSSSCVLEFTRHRGELRMLQDISTQVTQLSNRGLAYTSVTQAIIGCSNEIDRYLADYSVWSSQMQSQHDIHEVLAILRRQKDSVGPTVTQLTAAVILGCVTLVDATGHEHAISVTFCASFQQLNDMLQVLFKRDSIEAQLQRRYMEQGQYDLCIDDDKQVTRLTSHKWPSIEAGTKIVMRVVIEQQTTPSSGVDYKCHFCGAVNHIGAEFTKYTSEGQGRSIDCRECKRRFQITRGSPGEKRSIHSSNIDCGPTRTEAEMHLIRNFRVQQTALDRQSASAQHHDLDELFLCMWDVGYGSHCHTLIDGYGLSAHLRSAHGIRGSDTARVLCRWDCCNREFNKESLTRHIKGVHMRIAYECECGRLFSRKYNLNSHKRQCSIK